MSPSSRSNPREGGFTLIEVTVAMAVLVIVLVLSGTLLFSMKSFAQRQQSFAEPRQTARRAIEYLTYYVRGASDMNTNDSNLPIPDALVTYYDVGGATKQATYNNVADDTLADVGTDLFTIAKPLPGSMPLRVYGAAGTPSGTISALYTQGCGDAGDDATNLTSFKQVVGYDDGTSRSGLFLIYDPGGAWMYFQITGAVTSNCANVSVVPPSVISMPVTAGGSLGINPARTASPGLNCQDSNPCSMTAGIQFVTFRVRSVGGTPRLEQLVLPTRLFDAAQDNPGNSFTPLLDNVEDLQVAYIYTDGTIWNSSQATRVLGAPDYPDGVPNMQQAGAAPNDYDAVNVRGLRLSVVARSAQAIPTIMGGTAHIPAVEAPEDSTVAYPQGFYHHRLTVTIMIQNRVLGS